MERDETSKDLSDFLSALRSSEPREGAGGAPGQPAPASTKPPLEDLLRGFDQPAAPAPKAPPAAAKPPVEAPAQDFVAPAPPSPAPAGPQEPAPGGANFKEFLMHRVEELEKALREERQRASAADARAARQEGNRSEVEEQLKTNSEMLRNERETAHNRGRIEALESRLDKMLETWNSTLERLVVSRVAGLGSEREPRGRDAESPALLAHIEALVSRIDRMHETWKAVLERSGSPSPDPAKEGAKREEESTRTLARIDALESRLRETHQAWGAALKGLATSQAEAAAGLARQVADLKAAAATQGGASEELSKVLARVNVEMSAIAEKLSRVPDSVKSLAIEDERSILAGELRQLRAAYEKGIPELLEASQARASQAWITALGRVSAAQTAASAEASREAAEVKAELGRLSGVEQRLAGLELKLEREQRLSAGLQASLKRLVESWPAALERIEAVQRALEKDSQRMEAGTAQLAEGVANGAETTRRELQALTAGIRSLIGNVAEAMRRAEESGHRAKDGEAERGDKPIG